MTKFSDALFFITTDIQDGAGTSTNMNDYPAPDLIDATQNFDSYAQYSGALKALAVTMSKMSHDLRLMSSGPKSGFNEINLPARQPGSLIMPGKINPVIPEAVSQIAF